MVINLCEYFGTVASEGDLGGSNESPPQGELQMCLLERREATICPIDMTLAARLQPQSK